jgi:hypothetical protein
MTLRVASTEQRQLTGERRRSGAERMLDAVAKRYALAVRRNGVA